MTTAKPPAAHPAPDERPAVWVNGLEREAAFWKRQLSGEETRWQDQLAKRFADGRELHPEFQLALPFPPDADLHILDVGSGPATVLGTRRKGHIVTITAVDPLADEYNKMIDQAGLTPVVRPIRCDAERLLEHFGPEKFDATFSRNAIDHCYDPMLAIRQMIAVTKPGGVIRLEHALNEGQKHRYGALHQWNFCEEAGAFIIWNQQTRIRAFDQFGPMKSATCTSDERAVYVTMVKTA